MKRRFISLSKKIEQTGGQQPFLKEDYFLAYQQNKNTEDKNIKKQLQQTLTDLEANVKKLKNRKLAYYQKFLLEQLTSDNPDLFLMESVISSYQNAVQDTDIEDKGRYIQILFMQLLEEEKNNFPKTSK